DYNKVLNDKNGYIGSQVDDIATLGDMNAWKMAGNRIVDAVGDMGDSIGTKGLDFLGDYQNTVKLGQLAQDKKTERIVLADPTASAGEKRDAAQSLADGQAAEKGKTVAVNLTDSNQQQSQMTGDGQTSTMGRGLSDNNSNNVYINTGKVNMTSASDVAGETAHEVAHQLGASEEDAQRTQTVMKRVVTRENNYDGISNNTDSTLQNTWYDANKDSSTIKAGNQKIDQVTSGQADITLKYDKSTLGTLPMFGADKTFDTKPVIQGAASVLKLPSQLGEMAADSLINGAELVGKPGDFSLTENGLFPYLKATHEQILNPDGTGPKTTLGNQINAVQSFADSAAIASMFAMPATGRTPLSTVTSESKMVEAESQAGKIENVVKQIQANNIPVKINPKNVNTLQEGNVTLELSDTQKLNLRVETHPIPGSNGEPVRHANVELIQKVNGKNVQVRNDHITE
ncbi:hypothetical protein EB093_08885, partial [bacterium]|nr:hypothetical protein [bacterium]